MVGRYATIRGNNMGKNDEKKVETKTIQASSITITDSLSSVKLTRTAGGEIRPEVKVYDSDPQEASTIAEQIMDKLNKKYKVNE